MAAERNSNANGTTQKAYKLQVVVVAPGQADELQLQLPVSVKHVRLLLTCM